MQALYSRLRQSASVKVFSIGALILILLIPLAMVKGVIRERDATADVAKRDIMQTWGGAQLVAGPVLVLPVRAEHTSGQYRSAVQNTYAYFLPNDVSIDATVDTEVRYRGLHKAPVYSAVINLTGSIERPNLDALNQSIATPVIFMLGSFGTKISPPRISRRHLMTQLTPCGRVIRKRVIRTSVIGRTPLAAWSRKKGMTLPRVPAINYIGTFLVFLVVLLLMRCGSLVQWLRTVGTVRSAS